MSQAQNEDWVKRENEAKARKAALDAEAAAAEAEVLRLTSLKKLADLQAPADPAKAASAETLAAAKLAKDIAEAKKAQADAEFAAFKSKVGEMPTSGIQGSVELGDKAGSMETALLAAKATASASTVVAAAVTGKMGRGATVFIFPPGEPPDLKALREFRALSTILKSEFALAKRNVNAASNELPLAAAGVALDAVTKLLGFFRSDFKVGGSELTADQGLLAESVAGNLRAALDKAGDKDANVYVYSLYYRYDPASDSAFLAKEIKPLENEHSEALDVLRVADTRLAAFNADAAKLTADADKDRKAKLLDKAAKLQAAIDRLKKVDAVYVAMMERLAGEGKTEALVRQYEISEKLAPEKTYVLTAKMHKVGGSHYVEKNLWTTFGAMPFKVMGGVIVSYSLFEAKSSKLVASELIPVHGGFESAKNVNALLHPPK